MRTNQLLTVWLLASVISGCRQQEEIIAPGLNRPQGTFSFVFDTKRLTFEGDTANYYWDSVSNATYLYISAYNPMIANPKTLYLGLYQNTPWSGPMRTSGVSAFTGAGMSARLLGDSLAYVCYAGTVTVSRMDTARKFISGTFNGYAVKTTRLIVQLGTSGGTVEPAGGDTIAIQSGVFDLPMKVHYIDRFFFSP